MLLPLLLIQTTMAATLRVGDSEVYTSINAAIDASADGDSIVVSAGTYREQINLDGKSVSITGIAGSEDTLIVGTGASTIQFDSGEGPDTIISGFTVQNSDSSCMYIAGSSPHLENLIFDGCGAELSVHGGAIHAVSAAPTLAYVTFSDNRAELGGAIFVGDDSNIHFENCAFNGNEAQDGGAIAALNSTVEIANSRFQENEALFGRAGAIFSIDTSLDIGWSDFEENRSTYDGGAILGEGGSLTLTDVGFSNNVASFGNGGAIQLVDTSIVEVNESIFNHNEAGYDGGAFSGIRITSIDVQDTQFTANRSGALGAGGALFLESSTLSMHSGVMEANDGPTGGGIQTVGSDIQLVDMTFSENQATGRGGAINTNGGTLDVDTSTFENNRAFNDGGSIHSASVDTTISSSNFIRNETSGGDGGAIHLQGFMSMLDRVIIVGNSARNGGAVYVETPSNFILQRSVLQENTSLFSGGALFATGSTIVFLQNNDFLGNTTLSSGTASSGAAAAQLHIAAEADIRNNIIGWGVNGAGLLLDGSADVDLTIRHNNVYENLVDYEGIEPLPDIDEGNFSADPKFVALSFDGDFTNDDLYLRVHSPCLAAGDPDLVGPDWLPGDLGPYGLSEGARTDEDGDGFAIEFGDDCDDTNPSIHIAAEEVCDDGLDNDCDSSIDEDCEESDTADPPETTEGDSGEDWDTAEDAFDEGDEEGEAGEEGEGDEGGHETNDRDASDSTMDLPESTDLYAVNGKGCSCSSRTQAPLQVWWSFIPLILIRRRSP
mgnify:CR=1 FL=1